MPRTFKKAGLFLFCVAAGLCAQTQSNPNQLPASGRALQSDPVPTSQAKVNGGGQNSVNLSDSSVKIQAPFQGSVPTGTDTGTVTGLSLQDALQRALNF